MVFVSPCIDVSLSKNMTPPKQTAKKKVYFYIPCDFNMTRKSEHCGFVCFPSTLLFSTVIILHLWILLSFLHHLNSQGPTSFCPLE